MTYPRYPRNILDRAEATELVQYKPRKRELLEREERKLRCV